MTSEGYSPISHGYAVEIDISVEAGDWPADAELRHMVADAVAAALSEIGAGEHEKSELSIVFTDDAAMKTLNAGWRGKDKPTNVLSFPAFPVAPGDALPAMLGDIVLGYETVRREADEEKKPLGHHICHLVVHGLLHLVGHDHESDEDAEIMEALERRALARLAIPDPYA